MNYYAAAIDVITAKDTADALSDAVEAFIQPWENGGSIEQADINELIAALGGRK